MRQTHVVPRSAPPLTPRILLVEDDEVIGAALKKALEASGHRTSWATDGAAAIDLMAESTPDLVLLDVGLPDIDGFALCRQLRGAHRELPIVIITARDAEIDVVVGLDAGATDYVTKPFSYEVLSARIRAHLRSSTPSTGPLVHGPLRIDSAAHLATLDGRPLDLRPREFELLVYLVERAGAVVRREQVLADIWDLHWETSSKTLEMHMVGLRRKLGGAIDITAVRGVGYRLETR